MDTRRQNFWIIVAFLLAVGGLLVLSATLPQIEFAPGQVFFLEDQEQPTRAMQSMGLRTWSLVGAWKTVGILVLWVILPISAIYFMVSPEARKKIIRRALAMSLTAYALFLMLRSCGQVTPEHLLNFSGLSPESPDQANTSALQFQAQQELWLQWIANLVFVGLLTYLFWQIWRWWQLRPASLADLSAEASQALDDLSAGAHLEDTILRCYAEMHRIVQKRRGLQRQAAMTPREFTQALKRSGLPETAVDQLTHLFEQVRYGGGAPLDADAAHRAKTSLQAIVAAGLEDS
ncbi:MAG: DUF4129 domain-containing protein [Anaerolineae bacterium]|nr:DUF4129 domain-containing protein [Anaerolineae bacterium]